MLENSYLHESLEAKEIDTLLKEYQDITAKLTDLDESKKKVLERLIALSETGVNETSKFVYNKGYVNGKTSIKVTDTKKLAPELFDRLEKLGLVSTGNGYFVIRNIKLKGDRV